MRYDSATDAKQRLGAVLDAAQREPVVIRRHRRDVAVVLSAKEYDRLRGLNITEFQEFCDRVAGKAAARGLTEKKRHASVLRASPLYPCGNAVRQGWFAHNEHDRLTLPVEVGAKCA